MNLTPYTTLNGSKRAEGVYSRSTLCSLGLCRSGCHEDSPKRRTERASQGLTAAHNPRCRLTPAIVKRICTWHPCLSHVAPAYGATLHCSTSLEITSERNNSKRSSEITLLVHRKCSTARHKAHRAHLPPWTKKGSSEPSPGLP